MSLAAVAAACGSSSTTATAPATVPRCGVTLATTEISLPASGGTGRIAVSAARECAWAANSTAPWLAVTGASSGQGDGTVEYAATPNADATTRRGVIELNDQRANVTQAAAACTLSLGQTSESFSLAGGSGTIPVQASSASCTWTAASEASWITVRSGASGTGNGTVTYDVAAGTGPPRTGTILVAGLRFAINQSEGCTFAASPTAYAPGPSGGTTVVSVTTAAPCPWTAVSNVPWITVAQGATGTGPGAARLVVDATTGPSRTGTVLVAGQSVTVTQGGDCRVSVAPLAQPFSSAGGTGSATIEAAGGCSWSAASNAPWITLTGPTSGSGGGAIAFTVAALTGASRTGTISVAGSDIVVSQSSGCSFAISPASATVAAAGGTGSVSVTAESDCAWSATSNAPWLSITSGANGRGNGTVQYSAAATTGGPRSGTLAIGGQTFTVSQEPGQGPANSCTFRIDPGTASVAAAGGTGNVSVSSPGGCAWTATSNASWLSITSGANGNGNGTVQYSAAATTGGPRSGTLTIGGQTFTVSQEPGQSPGNSCAVRIEPGAANVAAAGGTGSVAVSGPGGCAWTATSNVSWLSITSGTNGSGNGTVQYSVAATTGGGRSGTLTIGGHTFTVNQGSGCTFGLAPASLTIPAAGGASTINVAAGAGCAWTASSNAPWLTIASGANGSGNGVVSVTAAANPAVARSGTLTIAGQSYKVDQASGCSFGVTPTTIPIGATGGNTTVTVSASGGCTWAATSGVNWITVSSGATGSGNGKATLSVAANPGPARQGTATIAGVTLTVEQAAAQCTYAIDPDSRGGSGNGGSHTIAVTAGAGCAWTAVSNVSWITITSGASGAGNGTVAYTFAPNTTNAARSGTITIGGQTYTQSQMK